ncbi:DUF4259 domain-containing protein [Nonomuraea sp. NPDC003804]|uniref:DUF4259 domain-containing protein n=1 Tax=Nonomuraea sp. NPDC003804 TaxID=3154547 RepID=UPI0033A960C0
MGTWDIGPFDNDTAADWCGGLQDAVAEQRPLLIRKTLAAVAGQDDYLDSDEAGEAIAAAAIVASQRSGTPITSPYAPDFLVEGGSVAIDDELVALAVAALDRVVAEDSEWRELWAESGAFSQATAVIAQLRTDLVT